MKNLIIAAYLQPTFLRGDDHEWREVAFQSNLLVNNKLKWHEITYSGSNYDLLFYGTMKGEIHYHEDDIVLEIESLLGSNTNALILLHTGQDPAFTHHLENSRNLGREGVKIKGFSGGSGLFYEKLMNAGGYLFPKLVKEIEFQQQIESILESVWSGYFNTSDFRDNYEGAL